MTSHDPQPGRSWPLSRKTIVIRAAALAAAGLAIYLLLPSLTRVLASWPRLRTLDAVWLAVALVAELASFTCTFALQRLAALRATGTHPRHAAARGSAAPGRGGQTAAVLITSPPAGHVASVPFTWRHILLSRDARPG